MSRSPEQMKAREALLLSALPGTQKEIVERTSIPQSSLVRWLEQLEFEKKIHWRRIKRSSRGGNPQRIYEAGPMPADSRRRRQYYASDAERMRAYRERLISSGDWQDILAKRRAKNAANKTIAAAKAKVHPDNLMSAFFGASK